MFETVLVAAAFVVVITIAGWGMWRSLRWRDFKGRYPS